MRAALKNGLDRVFRMGTDNRSLLAALLYLLMFAYAISFTMIGPLMPALISRYSLKLSQGGLIISFRSIGEITAIIAAGFLADLVRKSRLLTLAFLVFTLALFIIGLGPGFGILLLFFGLLGISTKMLDTVLNAYIADIYQQRRSFYLMLLHIFFGIGALLGPLYSRTVLNRAAGWNFSFLIFSAVCLIILVLWLLAMRDAPAAGVRAEQARPGDVLRLFTRPPMLLLGLIMFMYLGNQAGLTVWLPMYMEDFLGADSLTASLALSVFWGGIIAGRIISSRLLARYSEISLILWGALAGGVVLSSALFVNLPGVLLAAAALAGLFTGATIPLLVGIACRWYPLQSGGAIAIIYLFGSLAAVFFPWLIGLAAERVSFKLGILITGLNLLVIFFLSIPVYREDNKGSYRSISSHNEDGDNQQKQ